MEQERSDIGLRQGKDKDKDGTDQEDSPVPQSFRWGMGLGFKAFVGVRIFEPFWGDSYSIRVCSRGTPYFAKYLHALRAGSSQYLSTLKPKHCNRYSMPLALAPKSPNNLEKRRPRTLNTLKP